MKAYIIVFVIFLSLALAVTSVIGSDEVVVFSGIPVKKDMSDIEGTEQVEMKGSDAWSFRVEITRKGNEYIWASRENKTLILSKSGSFYNFVEPGGSGYVKAINIEGKTLYMEHLIIGLKNITYWGFGESLNLD